MQKAKVIDYIVCWLREYCNNASMKGFAVGVSGGIDSAVTSTLCAKTSKKVILLNLPIFQASEQVSRAELRHALGRELVAVLDQRPPAGELPEPAIEHLAVPGAGAGDQVRVIVHPVGPIRGAKAGTWGGGRSAAAVYECPGGGTTDRGPSARDAGAFTLPGTDVRSAPA